MAQNLQHNPQDTTGREKARLAALHAEEQKAKASSMAMMTAEAEQAFNDVVDLSGPGTAEEQVRDAEGVISFVEVNVPKKEMRVNTDLANVTIGHGTDFTFVTGQKYKVDAPVYHYLDEKGFVWH